MIGGGPAGSSAARLLATWGHRVHLVTRPRGESRLAESLPPSCGKLFHAIGLSEAIDRAGFIRSTGNTVWWGSETPRVELFADGGRGWQVEAEALAVLLLDQAVRAGVQVERRTLTADPSTHRAMRSRDSLRASGRRHPPSLADLTTSYGATRPADEKRPFILDCSGRAGVLARAYGLREYDEGPRTIALVASWRSDRDWNVPDTSHTIVESYEGGWAWSVPTSAQHRHVAVMVDPQRSGLARGGSAREIYLAEIAKTREFRSLVGDAALDAGPWGWDASTYHAQRYAGDDWLLVGDAGSFIDPLSSAGVKKALASGWLAAVVAHTCLIRPEMRTHAVQFFDEREISIQHHFVSITRRMLADAAAGHTHRFWADRWDEETADGIRHPPSLAEPTSSFRLRQGSGGPPKLQRRLVGATRAADDDDECVRVAFERLRQSSVFAVRRAVGLVIEPCPAVSGSEIVLEQQIVEPGVPSGIRFVRDVDLIVLIDLAPHCAEVAELFDAYCHRSGPVALPDFLRALATALARGWLVAE